MRVLFIGFALPQDEFDAVVATDAGMPVQTQRFGWSVVEALRAAGADVDLVSAAPVTDYPSNSRLLFRGRRFEAGGTTGTTVSFVNVTGAKHLTRFATATAAVRRLTGHRRPDAVLVHGVHSPFIWVAVRAARRLGIPSVVVLTDPPSLTTPYDGRCSRRLKGLDRHVILSGLAHMSGVVALTPDLARDFAPGRPWLQFEGIARPLDGSDAVGAANVGGVRGTTGTDDGPRVVYAGALAAEYGVDNLIEAARSSAGSWTLHLYGAGALAEEARSAAAADDRVVFHGMVDSATLAAAYAGASLLVNPRPVDQDFVRYSFPSKLLEYLSSGRPVLTTRLPTIPEDYVEHLVLTGDTAQDLADSIDAFLAGVSSGAQVTGREFILRTRGVTAQGTRLTDFLRLLGGRPARE